jgi:F-type H+-transporting ATPase subunit delta
MAESSTLARPYARAAFEYAGEHGLRDAWLHQLRLCAAVAAEPSVARMLANPALTAGSQVEQFIALCADDIDQPMRQFLQVLSANRRLALLPEILQQFAQLKADSERSVDVQVVSAFALPDEMRDRISAALGRRLQREVNVSTHTDSSLIGGVLIRAGDTVIDGSVRGRLNKLAEALTH